MYRSSFQTHHMRRVALACLFAISALLLLTDSNPWTTAQAGGRVDVKQDQTASAAFSSNDRSSVFSIIRMMNEVNQPELGKLERSVQAGATNTNAWLGVSGSMAGSRPAPVAPSTTLTVNKKLLSNSNITIGAPVIYEVEVKSSHPTTYNHLSVKDTLPPGFVFVSATYALSGATGPLSTPSLNSVTSELTFGEFTLSLNGVITITINGYFTTGGPKSNSVTANDSADPVPAGTATNTATDNETVSFNSFPVDLKVEKCVSSNSTCGSTSAVSLPGLLHYQITVTNKTAQPVYLGGLLTIRDFFTNNSSIPVQWSVPAFTCTPLALCPDLPPPTTLATLPSFSTATIVFKYDLPGALLANDSGFLPGNASYKIEFDINLSTASTCAPATVTIQNQARLDLSNGVQSLTDQAPADNTSAPSVVTTATTNLAACSTPSPSPTPTPMTVTKVQCATTTGPCTAGAAVNWNAPVRYQVTVTNPNATQSFAATDNVYKSLGTPAFRATVISGPCIFAGCTSLTSPTLLTNPVFNNPTVNFDSPISFTLWTGTIPSFSGTQVIEYLVKYVPVCETDTRADHIFNYCAAGNASSPAVQADLPEAGVCDLAVTKTETPPGPILFGQPHAYKVVFANPSGQAMDVFVRDVLSVKSNRYGAVPFDYSVTCTATQGTITPLTGPPLPLTKNVTGASASYQSAGWRGVRLLDQRMNFGAASTLTCQVNVTAHQPADTNPHCQGADNPQLTNDDPRLVNSAYMDPSNFDDNGSTPPKFYSSVASDLPLCRSVIVSKTANAHSFAPGGTIVYTITVENKGDDPVGSLTLKDIIQPPLSGVSVGTCTPANCTPPVPSLSTGLLPHHVDVSYGLLQPNAAVSFPLTVTAPQAGGSYPNVAVASFLAGGNFYFQGNEQSFLQSEENIQVLTPALKKSFDPGQIGPNGTGTLTFTITNLNGDPKQTGMSFSDTLPAGLQIVSVVSNGCSGNVTISPGGETVTLTGGQLVGPNADGSGQHSCQISVKVKASDACGVYKNNKDNFSQVANLDVSNIDEQLTVVGCSVTPPTLTKKFDRPKIPMNGASTLTFTITNSTGDPKQTGIAFSDTLPPGLQIAGVVSNGCSGNVTVSPDGQTVTLNNGQLVGPNADGSGQHSCQIVVRVKAIDDCGVYRNTEKNFSDVKNLNVKGIDEQIVVGDCGGSGLTIEKKVPGAPPGFKGQFNFLVQCATPKGFYQEAVTIDWPTPGFITLNDVPTGSQCTVTEGPPPASLPAGFNWAGLPAYLPPGGVISVGPKGGQVVVTDTLSPCNESGQVTITKVIEGLPKDYIGVFEGTLQCWVSDKLLTYPVTLTSPNGLSTTVGNIPLGSTCTFQETGQPPLKGDLKWNQPIYNPIFGTVTLTGECCQQITVINQARHCCSQSGSSGSNPITPTNFLDHAIEQNPASYDTPVKSTPVIRAGSKPAGGKPRGN